MTTPASRRPCSMVSAPLPGAPVRTPGTPGDSRTRRRAPRPGASGNSPALHFGPVESAGSATGRRQPRLGTLAHSHLQSGRRRLARCEKPCPTPTRDPALQPPRRSAVVARNQVSAVANSSPSVFPARAALCQAGAQPALRELRLLAAPCYSQAPG